MEIFVQQLINGITLGSIYGLIAIGYTMVFRHHRHGQFRPWRTSSWYRPSSGWLPSCS